MDKDMSKKAGMGNKKFLIGFIVIILVIIFLAVFGKNGLLDVNNLMAEKEKLVERNRALEEENNLLVKEIGLLKNDKRYVEAVARKELGMVAADEIIYMVEDE
jgi:cell division protein FtsL